MLLQRSNPLSAVYCAVELSFRGTDGYGKIIVPQWGHLTGNEVGSFLPLFQLVGLLSLLLSQSAQRRKTHFLNVIKAISWCL